MKLQLFFLMNGFQQLDLVNWIMADDPTNKASVGKRLTALRMHVAPSQVVIANRLGIDKPRWNNWEKGVNLIRIDIALLLCAQTGVTLDWIYRGTPGGLPIDLATALEEKLQKVA